jgi:phage shock protein PspC (stress-responsive transcriptional regulator)
MSEHTTHITATRRLERSRSDRMLAGVSGGLARYFEIHPAVVRVAFVVLTVLGGAGVLLYAAAALIMPDEGKEDSIATAAIRDRRERPWPLIGLGLLAVAGAVLLSRADLWPDGDAWVLFLIAGGMILWIVRPRGNTATAAAGPVERAAQDSRRMRSALRGFGIFLASLVVLVLLAVAALLAVFDVHVGRGIGDNSYTVTSTQELRRDYRLGIGSLDLDLSRLHLPVGETHIDTSVDIGDLHVIVPQGIALRAHGDAQAGYVSLLGDTDDGRNADVDVKEAGRRVLVLDADVGAGSIRVDRAP